MKSLSLGVTWVLVFVLSCNGAAQGQSVASGLDSSLTFMGDGYSTTDYSNLGAIDYSGLGGQVQSQTDSILTSVFPAIIGAAAGGLIGYEYGGEMGAAIGGLGGLLMGQLLVSSLTESTAAAPQAPRMSGNGSVDLGYGQVPVVAPQSASSVPLPQSPETLASGASNVAVDLATARQQYMAALAAYQEALKSADGAVIAQAKIAFTQAQASFSAARSSALAGQ